MGINDAVLAGWPGGVKGGAALPIFVINDYLRIAFQDLGLIDSFGRLRTSEPGNRTDFTFTYDKQPLVFDEIAAGSGSATHDAALRAVYLSTGGTASGAGMRFMQRFYSPYTPGNSQEIVMTGNLNPDNLSPSQMANIRAEIGYGDALNGVGFRFDANGAGVFIRSSIGGSAADLAYVPQAYWHNNVPSVDWSKSRIFIIDFQSLAVGRVRFYLNMDGEAVLVHEIHNDNRRVGPYWQTGSLPPYWSVENMGIATAVGRVLAICVTVKSEGGLDLLDLPGYPFAKANGETLITVSTSLIPLLSIQIKTTFNSLPNRGLVMPTALGFVADNVIHYHIILNPTTLTGAAFTSVDNYSLCNFDVTASAVAGGRIIDEGYAGGSLAVGRLVSNERGITGKNPLSINAAGTVGDILTIAAVRVGSVNAMSGASLVWKEIR